MDNRGKDSMKREALCEHDQSDLGCVHPIDENDAVYRDLFIFRKDAGGNSTFTRLEAEVAFNRDKPEHEMATDTSLNHGDLRRILKAFRRQADFTDALTAKQAEIDALTPKRRCGLCGRSNCDCTI